MEEKRISYNYGVIKLYGLQGVEKTKHREFLINRLEKANISVDNSYSDAMEPTILVLECRTRKVLKIVETELLKFSNDYKFAMCSVEEYRDNIGLPENGYSPRVIIPVIVNQVANSIRIESPHHHALILAACKAYGFIILKNNCESVTFTTFKYSDTGGISSFSIRGILDTLETKTTGYKIEMVIPD